MALFFGAVAGYWLDGQRTAPTADAAFFSASTGLLATLTFRWATRGAVHFLCFRPRVSAKNGCPTGVLAAGMSDARGNGGGVLTLHAGLLINAGAVVPSSSEVVMEVSASLTEHVGPAPDLAAAERNHGRSLTELA